MFLERKVMEYTQGAKANEIKQAEQVGNMLR